MIMNWKLKFGLVAVCIAVIFFAINASNFFGFLKTPIEVKTIADAKSLKDGDHVTLDVTACYGYLISETTTTTKNGKVESTKESSRYYLIPYMDPTEDYVEYCLTVKINSKDFSKMESATTAFEDYWEDYNASFPSTSFLKVDGLVTNMKDEEKKYATDYVNGGYMEYIYLATPEKKTIFLMVVLSGVFLAFGVLFLVLFVLGKKKEEAKLAEFRASNPGYYHAPAGVNFDNNMAPQNPYAFDPNTDPRFNGMASGNPVGQANSVQGQYGNTQGQYNAQPQNFGNFNEVQPSIPSDNSGNFNEVNFNNDFNNNPQQ
jgi:hypothetical protein